MLVTNVRMSSWPKMSLFCVWIALQLMTACLAQDSSSNTAVATTSTTSRSPSSSTSSAPLQTHTIQVGLADHRMVPNVTQAAVGDTLEFRFYPLNHSVVRAEYLMPCVPYEISGPGKTGFFTGFHPVSTVLDDAPSYSVRVNDTNPIFFYCSAPGSCINYGMVGAVNPSEDQDIEQQHLRAKDSTYMLNPGEPFPAEGVPETGHGGINGTGAGDGGGTVADTQGGSKSGLSTGAIVGIAIGGVAVVVLAALAFFFWGRTKSLEDEVDRKAGTVRRVSSSRGHGSRNAQHGNEQPRSPGGNMNTTNDGLTTLGYNQNLQYNPLASNPPLSEMTQDQHAHHPLQQSGFSSPAPAYYTSPLPPHKLDMNSPTGHPAYPSSSPSPIQNFSHHHHNGAPSPAPYELDHNSQPQNIHNGIPYTTTSPTYHPAHVHPAASPDEVKYFYGQGGTTQVRQVSPPPPAAAPSYFETVHRPGPLHLNGRAGAVEMGGGEERGEVEVEVEVGSAVKGDEGHVEGDRGVGGGGEEGK